MHKNGDEWVALWWNSLTKFHLEHWREAAAGVGGAMGKMIGALSITPGSSRATPKQKMNKMHEIEYDWLAFCWNSLTKLHHGYWRESGAGVHGATG